MLILGFVSMSFGNKVKQKVLDSSDSYNHYKKENKDLSNKLNSEIKDLKKDIKALKKSQKETERVLDSYHVFLSNLYLDYELKPKGMLKNTQDLCQELLDFFDKVCRKHNLQYWIDFGNFLGAVRHQGYIPWDDDLDVGMPRDDSIKFLEVIDEELEIHGLSDIIDVSRERFTSDNNVVAFTQIRISERSVEENELFGGLDIFPMDFIIDPSDNIEEEFMEARKNFHNNILNGMERQEVYDEFYKELNLSHEKQEYYIHSVELFGGLYKFKLFKTENLLPLKEIEFNGKLYPCPNNEKAYLETIYGKSYMDIPKIIRRHTRVSKLKDLPYAEEKFEKYFKLFKEANRNFKY